MIEYEIDW